MRIRHLPFLLSCALTAAVSLVSAQGLDPAKLLEAATDTWSSYHGDYSGRHHSPLSQINAGNVKNLSLAWVYRANQAAIKSEPLEINGILYFTVPDHVWAVDARTGRELWHYVWKSKSGTHIGNRGVGVYGNWLYFETPDAYLVSLNIRDGKERWHKELADVALEYFGTPAPMVIGNHILVGVSGDSMDVPGFLEARDPETGDLQWRWYTTPRPGQPGAETWPNPDAMAHGGGMTWMPGTYDPQLNLLYWATGNPNPVMAGQGRLGDDLWTCSIVALNPDNGKLVWAFQASPHDTHDWDAVQVPVLIDGEIDGKPRKLLAQASRNGYYFLLDRTNGKNLLSVPYVPINWSTGVNANGNPQRDLKKDPSTSGTLVEPSAHGGTNWQTPAFNPGLGLFFLHAERSYSVFFLTDTGEKPEGYGGRDDKIWAEEFIQALDYKSGKVRWRHDIGRGMNYMSMLSTQGQLLFSGDNSGNALALAPADGKTLWHANLGGIMNNAPITYELDGRQYLLLAANDSLFAFTLPSE
jgi:acido-empty-quinoprotein group A